MVRKFTQKPWNNAWNHEKQCKRKGNMDIPTYGEENDKKIVVEPCQVGEREKVLKCFEKMVWTS